MARVIANPPDDEDFVRRVEELTEVAGTPEKLEQLLRSVYSEARVVRGVTDVVERWYAYRDGHWTRV